MCEFLSWIEKPLKTKSKYYYLTYDMIYNTPRGEILRREIGSERPFDFYGHEAIRKYYQLHDTGYERECFDFSSPAKFPTVIVKAIKNGDFKGLACPEQLLSQQALAEYQKTKKQAWAVYQKTKQQALAEYEKVEQPTWAEYEKVEQQAWAEYEKVEQPAFWDLFNDTNKRNPLWR